MNIDFFRYVSLGIGCALLWMQFGGVVAVAAVFIGMAVIE